MAIRNRHYTSEKGFSEDYGRVWDFLVRINQEKVVDEGFLWGRWEWMFCLERWFDTAHLSSIGIWEEEGIIVAIATYEQNLGYVWFLIAPEYEYLQEEMLLYAEEYMKKDGVTKVLIDDTNRQLQRLAATHGFYPTQEKEVNAVIPLDYADLSYRLPEGFRVVSLAEEFDLVKYNRALWKGFNHEGEEEDPEEVMLEGRRAELSSPHCNLNLKIAVAAPDGNFVSYCGMWYVEGTDYALVEPVATDPAYRKMGLGKAAVLEGVKRCGQLGAKVAYVGSSQQFYYSIGFQPYSNKTWWEKKS